MTELVCKQCGRNMTEIDAGLFECVCGNWRDWNYWERALAALEAQGTTLDDMVREINSYGNPSRDVAAGPNENGA